MRPIFSLFTLLALFPVFATAQAAQPEAFQKKWDSYVRRVSQIPLQEDCKPRIMPAKPGVPFKGTVILFHGFTACPQQFFELAKKELQPAGYDVVLPLLPGHGRKWTNGPRNGKKITKGMETDNIDGLPTLLNYDSIYYSYTREMNEIMKLSQTGGRVIGGLSVGAEMAVAGAYRDPELYDRMILLAPFFRSSHKIAWLFDRLSEMNAALTMERFKVRLSWDYPNRHSCRLDERYGLYGPKIKRAGICEFRVTHIGANQAFGEDLLNDETYRSDHTKIQIIAVAKDSTASTEETRQFVDKLEKATGKKPALCFYPEKVSHSMLSRADDPKQVKFWIDGMLPAAAAFIVKGTRMPEGEEVQAEPGYRSCDT